MRLERVDVENMPNSDASAWVFQANPKKWDVDRALADLRVVRWLVNQYRDDIRCGDRVFLWRSGPQAGVVAVCTTLADPAPLPDDKESYRYQLEEAMFAGERIRVPLAIEKVLQRPILRKALLWNRDLDGMAILRRPQGTNFPLEPGEVAALEQMAGPR